MKNNKILINIICIVFVLFFSIFLTPTDYRLDYFVITFLFFYNFKEMITFFKKYKVVTILFLVFLLYLFVQSIIIDKSLTDRIMNFIFAIMNFYYPALFFVIISNLKLDKKAYKIIHYILLLFTFVLIIYGFLTYIFDYNLVDAGMYVLKNARGRVGSFFINPNAYACYLVVFLNYILYISEEKQYIKWIFVILTVASICLTFSRFIYFVMALSLLCYVIYNLIKVKSVKHSKYNILIMVLIIYLSFFLPNNNYLYISLTNQFDKIFNVNITTNVNKTIDFITLKNDIKESEELIDKTESNEDNIKSSENTRSLFAKTALEVFKENVLLGVGGLNYHDRINEKFDEKKIDYVRSGLPHNCYLYLLTNYGLIGTILYISTMIMLFISCLKKVDNKVWTIMIIGSFLIINIATDVLFKCFNFYLLLMLSMYLCNSKEKK